MGKDDGVHGASSQAVAMQPDRASALRCVHLLWAPLSWLLLTSIAGAVQVPRPMSLSSKLFSGVTSGTRWYRGVWVCIHSIAAPYPALLWAKVSKDGDSQGKA